MRDGSVVDSASSGVVVDGDRDRRVVTDDRTVAPDDRTAWSLLKHHVVAVVACKVELVDWLDYINTRTQLA